MEKRSEKSRKLVKQNKNINDNEFRRILHITGI